MSRLILTFSFIASFYAMSAQDLSEGRMTDSNGVGGKILFSKVNAETDAGYITTYEIRNAQKEVIYTIAATHEKSDNSVELAISRDGLTRYSGVSIKKGEVGLYINSDDVMDTAFSDPVKKYTLLLSFQDADYTYPSINRITLTYYKDYLDLDPLSGMLIRDHKQMIAGMKPKVDSVAILKAQAEAAEAARKQKEKEDQERIKREDEQKKIEAERLKKEEEQRQAAERRSIYYSTYASKVSDLRNQDKAENIIEKEVDSYLSSAECADLTINTIMNITVDTLGAVRNVSTLKLLDEENFTSDAIIAVKGIQARIRALRLPITHVTIRGQDFPVNAQWNYTLKFESSIHDEKYHFSKGGALLDKDDIEVTEAIRSEFFKIHENKFVANKFKVVFCSHHIGAYTADTLIEVVERENGPGGPRNVTYRRK